MNIEARKISLAQRLFAIQQEAVLDKIEALLSKESTLSLDEKNAIDQGIKSLDVNDRISHNQVVNETQERYPNLF